MFCPNCGTNNADTSRFCEGCGAELTAAPETTAPVTPTYTAPVQPAAQPGKGLAIAGMVCGIISFFCFAVILGTLGIVFGSIAKKKGYTGGMATAGIACGVIGLSLWLIMLVACNGTLAGLGF